MTRLLRIYASSQSRLAELRDTLLPKLISGDIRVAGRGEGCRGCDVMAGGMSEAEWESFAMEHLAELGWFP